MLKVLKWPLLTQDLNTIKNLWVDLKGAVFAKYLKNVAEQDIFAKMNGRTFQIQELRGNIFTRGDILSIEYVGHELFHTPKLFLYFQFLVHGNYILLFAGNIFSPHIL